MKGLRKGGCYLLLIAAAVAQTAGYTRQRDEAPNLWLSRAQSLTDELIKDSESLSRYDRALLWARLGKAWQRDDAEAARVWIEKAVKDVESAPDDEDATGRSQRLTAARALLVVLGAQDKSLSARLNKVISSATEAAATADSRENAHAKAEAGLAVVESDPHRALQFGLASLRAGGSYKLASLLWRLRKRDVNLSDTLFNEIVAAARARGYDQNLLTLLPVVTFEGPSPSDKLRGGFLAVLAEGLLSAQNSAEERAALCRLAPLAAPLLPEFQRLLPQQAGAVRVQISLCQMNLDPQTRQEVADALDDKPLKTVDDLLEAAGKTSDLAQRVAYLERAAYAAFGARNYERAVAILDGVKGEERDWLDKMQPGLWESWRADFATAAAVAHLRRGDRPSVYQVIAAAPPQLCARVQIPVAAELAKKDAAAATQLLGEARAALAKAGAVQDFDSYLAIVRLYVTLDVQEALPTLSDAVKAMNRAGQSRQGDSEATDVEARVPLLSNEALMSRYTLPASLLAVDDVGVRQTIASVASPARRSAMRLKLLGAALEQRRAKLPERAEEMKGRDNANQ